MGSKLRLGVSISGFFFGQPPESWPTLGDAVRKVLEIDPSLGVEVHGAKSLDLPGTSQEEETDLIRAVQDAAFVTVHVRGTHWTWNPKGLREEIDLAGRLGAETLVLHPSSLGLTDFDDRPDFPEIRRIAAYAEQWGVCLALENIADDIWALDDVLDAVGDNPDKSNLAICVDLAHAALSTDAGRQPVRGYLERFAPQLRHLHLHDNDGDRDAHAAPGDGTIDWDDALKTLAKIGFDGTAVLEARSWVGKDPVPIIQAGLDHLRRIEAGLLGLPDEG